MAGRKRTLVGELAIKYCKEYDYWDNITGLGNLMYEENKDVFKDARHAQGAIRVYRGKSGETLRKNMKETFNVLKLPPPEEESYKDLHLPKAVKKWFVCGDLQSPFYDIKAIDAAFMWAKDEGCDGVYLNGDIMDCVWLSRFDKDRARVKRKTFQMEVDVMMALLTKIRKFFPDARIYYKEGNHEERLHKYLAWRAPELLGFPEFELRNILHLSDLDIHWIGDKRRVYAGKLPIMHGHEWVTGTYIAKFPAKAYYDKSGMSMMINHVHKSSEYTNVLFSGAIHTCFTLGCLCGLNPKWYPLNSWNHGAAIVGIEDNGNFHVTNKRIKDGIIL